jgi:hypothetical protein
VTEHARWPGRFRQCRSATSHRKDSSTLAHGECRSRPATFDTSIEFHGEDTNLGRRLAAVGKVSLKNRCYIYTSARRYKALGRGRVFRLYIRNFWWETIHHRPKDLVHEDVRL